jgi:hypothetical protein
LLRGVLLADLGRLEEAEAVFLELARELPDSPEPYNNLAALYARAGEHEKAIEVLKRALRTDPRYQTAYENLTKLYGELAGEAYERALGREAEATRNAVELSLLETMRPGSLPASGAPDADVVSAAARKAPPPAASAAAKEAPAETSPTQATAPEQSAEQVPAPASLWPTVEAWAAAWAGQQVERYLSFYADGFQPADGMERGAWERLRRERLTAPARIEVSLAFLDRQQVSADRWAVRFIQSFASDTYSDVVTKRLLMAATPEGWKILEETVEETSE